MSLPEWTDDCVLPPGAWQTDLDGVHERFVRDAPNQEERQFLFSALEMYLKWIRPLVGPSTIWIDGGFSMQKQAPPADVDIAILPDDFLRINSLNYEEEERLYSSLTHQRISSDVTRWQPFPRIQPMAGMLDAFIVGEEDRSIWHETWSRVKLDGIVLQDLVKGYAEVRI